MSTNTHVSARPGSSRYRNLLIGVCVSVALGLLISIFWSYEFVDDVIGGSIARLFLGKEDAANSGVVGALLFAVVAGLAGTFTACNIACFASIGPLATETSRKVATRYVLFLQAAAQMGWLALGMSLVAAAYGAAVVLAGGQLPMLSGAFAWGVPAHLVQASVINVLLGLGLAWVSARYLTGRPLEGRRGTFALGALLGLLIVGRPFPMFREVLADAVEIHPLAGIGTIVLVAIGNLAVVAVLYLGFITAAGPNLVRFSTRNHAAILAAGGYMLLTFAVFSVAYWGFRVPAIFGIGWFPNV